MSDGKGLYVKREGRDRLRIQERKRPILLLLFSLMHLRCGCVVAAARKRPRDQGSWFGYLRAFGQSGWMGYVIVHSTTVACSWRVETQAD